MAQNRTTIFGLGYAADGTVGLTGKNFVVYSTTTFPVIDRRIRPLDVSSFSRSNTSRTYYTNTVCTSSVVYKPYPNGGHEEFACGYIGGIGSWGTASCPIPVFQARLANRIKNQTANLGITLAKYRELCTLFTGFAGQLLDTAAKMQKLQDRQRKLLRRNKTLTLHPFVNTLVKGSSALYLGYLFGLRQFVSDFNAISEALRVRFDDPIYLTLDPLSMTETYRQTKTGGAAGSWDRWVSSQVVTRKVRVKARYRVFPNEQILGQMGMTNPLAVLYDAIPFSFVLNWIIPVGQYLSALDALHGVSDLRWYYTMKTTEDVLTNYPAYGGSALAHYKYETVTRTATQTNLKVPLPRYKPSAAASNVLTAVALLGVLSKKPQIAQSIVSTKRL